MTPSYSRPDKPSQIITGQAKRLSQAWPLAKYIETTDVFKPQALQSSIPNPLWPLRLFWCHQIVWPQQQGGNRKILGHKNCIRYHKIPEMGVSFFDVPEPGSLSQGYVSMGCFEQLGEITKMRGVFRSMFWKCVSGYASWVCFRVCFRDFQGLLRLVKVEHAQKSTDPYRPKFAPLMNIHIIFMSYNLNLKLHDPEKHEAWQCQVTFLQVRITKRTSISMAGGFRSSDAFRLQRFSPGHQLVFQLATGMELWYFVWNSGGQT